jgi:predicted nucleic acid-binding protein
MEKMGVVKPGLTPDIDESAKTADCATAKNAEHNKLEIEALDNDFRKKAANQVTGQLHN